MPAGSWGGHRAGGTRTSRVSGVSVTAVSCPSPQSPGQALGCARGQAGLQSPGEAGEGARGLRELGQVEGC